MAWSEESKLSARAEPLACTVYHGPGVTPESFGEPADDERMRTRWRPAEELLAAPTNTIGAAVLVVDASLLGRPEDGTLRRLPHHVMVVAGDAAAASILGKRAHVSVATIREVDGRRGVLAGACELSCLRLAAANRRRELIGVNRELRELNRIGIGLMAERDRTVLLHRILDVGKRLTQSDAGSMLLAEPDDNQLPRLRAVLFEVDSLPGLPALADRTLAVDDSSIIGHVAATKRHVVVDDAYSLPPHALFIANQSFDEKYGYHRRSMLVVPMVDHQDVLVGVMAFINRKSDPGAKIRSKEAADRWVLPYTKREVRLARSLASQAAVSIENADLHARIEHMLESFLKAAVTAVDQRDPTTAGHSMRVAALTTELAEAAERSGRGAYRELRFTRRQMRELRYAALLHDFGKVSVPDDVLLKAKKLPPTLWERVNARFDVIRGTVQVEHYQKLARLARSNGDAGATEGRLHVELASALEEVERCRAIVRDADLPRPLTSLQEQLLADVASRRYPWNGGTAPYVTDDELHFLRLPNGSLDDRERARVEEHVTETFRFLTDIPWTDDLEHLPAFAYAHHEKLNGTGYPLHLRGSEIPVQARMITIADIFDALTEADRPYKAAVPPDKALDILQQEAASGLLDAELVRILVESQCYRRILDEAWENL